MNNEQIIQQAKQYLALETEPRFQQELQALLDQQDMGELQDRFYQQLKFGTAGLRGIIGAGWNRMNPYVVETTTQGLASFLKKQKPSNSLSACISYDTRHYSRHFALKAAAVLVANDIKVYIVEKPTPTPLLSYMIRYYKSDMGIMITASHNPKIYNGYKAYWDTGAQIVEPMDQEIWQCIENTEQILRMNLDSEADNKMIQWVGQEFYQIYQNNVIQKCLLNKKVLSQADKLTLVYSPLHGTGANITPKVLKDIGYQVHCESEQMKADPDFTTAIYPNPEIPTTFDRSIALAKQTHAQAIIINDPDADRVGVAILDHQNNYTILTGNQVGALLLDYIYHQKKENQQLGANPYFMNSIVTSQFQNKLAKEYQIQESQVLTGFKWLALGIAKHTDQMSQDLLLVTEESIGYLVTDQVRDKDGVSTAAVIAEMVLYHYLNGDNLLDRLETLYKKLEYYQDIGLNFTYDGEKGKAKIQDIMCNVRNLSPKKIADIPVEYIKDFKEQWIWQVSDNSKIPMQFPKADVLQFFLSNGDCLSIRPSGTEPKIKVYLGVSDKDPTQIDGKVKNYEQVIQNWLK